MTSRLDNFVDENPWKPCRFADLVAAIREHPHSLIGLERQIGDVELRRLKSLCDIHFDSYQPLYQPLKTWLTRSDPKYRPQLASLLQPSQLLISHFASVSGEPTAKLALTATYDAALRIFFCSESLKKTTSTRSSQIISTRFSVPDLS